LFVEKKSKNDNNISCSNFSQENGKNIDFLKHLHEIESHHHQQQQLQEDFDQEVDTVTNIVFVDIKIAFH